MKRTLMLGLGLLAFALMPVMAQDAAKTGKIHGRVLNPAGTAQHDGTVSLSTDGGVTLKYSFEVSATGSFAGEAPQGTYMIIYRAKDTPEGKFVDSIRGIKIAAGEDVTQDIDMSREEYIKSLSPEQQKQLEDLKKANAAAMNANKIINALNADLGAFNQLIREADAARAAAIKEVGATSTRETIEAKAAEIRKAKYEQALAMMTKDTELKPDEPTLWTNIGRANTGLKKYEDAEAAYKKSLDLEAASKKPSAEIISLSNAGMGEALARQGKVAEAKAAYEAAVKADPSKATFHLKNEAIIFFQEKNAAAQVSAVDEALKAYDAMPEAQKTDQNRIDQEKAILYYIKGQGLIQSATIDPKTQRIVLPPDCADAYQHYLGLAPNGPYAAEVKGILDQAGQKIESSYSAGKSSKKKK